MKVERSQADFLVTSSGHVVMDLYKVPIWKSKHCRTISCWGVGAWGRGMQMQIGAHKSSLLLKNVKNFFTYNLKENFEYFFFILESNIYMYIDKIEGMSGVIYKGSSMGPHWHAL